MKYKNITISLIFFISFAISFIIYKLYKLQYLRFVQLHIADIENYIINYYYLPKNQERIIISWKNTVNSNKSEPSLKSILDQDTKIEEIFLNNFSQSQQSKTINDICTIIDSGKNYYDCNNLIPILLRERDADTILLLLNNDVVYGKNFISKIIKFSHQHPNSIIFSKFAILLKPKFFQADVDTFSNKKYKNLKSFLKSYSNQYNLDIKKYNYFANYKSIK